MKTVSHKHNGFTLIELLLVISIVSLLSSIVLGATTYARTKALYAKTQAGSRAVQTAMALYQDSKGHLPACPTDSTTNGVANSGTTCCVGSASCNYAGTTVLGNLNTSTADEFPDFEGQLAVFSASDNSSGYIYFCPTVVEINGILYCSDDAEPSLTFPSILSGSGSVESRTIIDNNLIATEIENPVVNPTGLAAACFNNPSPDCGSRGSQSDCEQYGGGGLCTWSEGGYYTQCIPGNCGSISDQNMCSVGVSGCIWLTREDCTGGGGLPTACPVPWPE